MAPKITPVFFDLETTRTFEEVDNDLTKLGFSIAVVRENKVDTVYKEHQSAELIQRLKAAQLIVGYNHVFFDFEVLKGFGLRETEAWELTKKSFDVMQELKDITGERISLDHVSRYNLPGAPGKKAPGLQCIVWYKQGKLDKIEEVCVDDVHRLAGVFGLIVSEKPLKLSKFWGKEGVDKFDRIEVTIPLPEQFKGAEWNS